MARFEVLGLDTDREFIRTLQGGSPAMALIPRGFEPLSAVQFRGSSRKKAAFSTHYAGRLWSAPTWISTAR